MKWLSDGHESYFLDHLSPPIITGNDTEEQQGVTNFLYES